MAVFILLSDGTTGKIELEPSERLSQDPHGIQLIPLGTFSVDVVECFEMAGISADRFLAQKGLWSKQHGRRQTFVYRIIDQEGNELAHKLHGKSGGLGMALALFIHNLRNGTGDLSVAATGVISDFGGRIGPVDCLSEKLRGAVQSLPPETKIYFPGANDIDKDSLESLRVEAARKEMDLIPVSAFGDAAEDFLPAPGRKWTMVKAAFLGLFILSLYLVVSYPFAIHLLEAGNYHAAESHLKIAARLFPFHNPLTELRRDLEQRFEVKVILRYLLQNGIERQHSMSRAPRGLSLGPSDSYALQVTPVTPVYLYIIQVDSAGEVHILFPHSDFASCGNPLEAQKTFTFPDKGRWFYPTGYQGIVETTLIFSRWRCIDLEQVLFPGEGKGSPHLRKTDLEHTILKRDQLGYGARMERIVYWHRHE